MAPPFVIAEVERIGPPAVPGSFDHRGKAQGRRSDRHPPHRFARLPYFGKAPFGGVLPCPAIFSSTGSGAFSFGKTKENGGASPQGIPLHWQGPLRSPAKNHHTCPSKCLQYRQNVPLTGTHRRGIVSSNLKKGIEKDADRERQQRGAAVGCKLPLPTTGAQPPPWSRPPICRLGRDLPLQRTRAARRQARKQGGTVEYDFSYLTPDFRQG